MHESAFLRLLSAWRMWRTGPRQGIQIKKPRAHPLVRIHSASNPRIIKIGENWPKWLRNWSRSSKNQITQFVTLYLDTPKPYRLSNFLPMENGSPLLVRLRFLLNVLLAADKTVRIWNAMDGVFHQKLEGHLLGISDVAWASDSKLLCSASDDKTIRIWDTNTVCVSGSPRLTSI